MSYSTDNIAEKHDKHSPSAEKAGVHNELSSQIDHYKKDSAANPSGDTRREPKHDGWLDLGKHDIYSTGERFGSEFGLGSLSGAEPKFGDHSEKLALSGGQDNKHGSKERSGDHHFQDKRKSGHEHEGHAHQKEKVHEPSLAAKPAVVSADAGPTESAPSNPIATLPSDASTLAVKPVTDASTVSNASTTAAKPIGDAGTVAAAATTTATQSPGDASTVAAAATTAPAKPTGDVSTVAAAATTAAAKPTGDVSTVAVAAAATTAAAKPTGDVSTVAAAATIAAARPTGDASTVAAAATTAGTQPSDVASTTATATNALTPSLVNGMTEVLNNNLAQNGTAGFDTNGVNDVQGQGTNTTWPAASQAAGTDVASNITTGPNGVVITDNPSNNTTGAMTLNQTIGGNGQDYYVQVALQAAGNSTGTDWTAAWMLPQSGGNGAMETDIFEGGFNGSGAANEQDAYHYHTIGGATNGGVANISSDIPNNSSGSLNTTNSMNTYGVLVTPGENYYYFDGQQVGSAATDPSLINTQQKLILNGAIPPASDSSWHSTAATSSTQSTFSNIQVWQA
jgi:hypothetical protein